MGLIDCTTLVEVLAGSQTIDEQLSEPMITDFTKANMFHKAAKISQKYLLLPNRRMEKIKLVVVQIGQIN